MRFVLLITTALVLSLTLSSLVSAMTIEQGVIVETGNASYRYTENISMDNLTVTPDCMIVEGGYFNDSYCNSSNVVFDFPDLNISAYLNVSPVNRIINISEGENVTFNVSEDASGPLEWAKWFLNSAYEVASDTYTYVTTYASSETTPDNVTVYSRTDGDTLTSTSWRLNVENTNLAPEINSFSASPNLLDWGASFSLTCNASDEDIAEENLTATMSYRLPDSTTWITENATWSGTDWQLEVNTSYVYEHVGYWDVQCRVQDDLDEYSTYHTIYDAVFVNETIVTPSQPDTITPGSGRYDMYVPLACLGSDWYNNVTRLYDFDAYINDTWKPIARDVERHRYKWYVGGIGSNTTVKTRCRATNSAGNSSWRESDNNITIQHRSTFNLFYDGMLDTLRPKDHVLMSVYASMEYENMYLESAFVDCTNDGISDYAFRMFNQTSTNTTQYPDTMHEQFTCVYYNPGIHTVKTGIFIERINESQRWQGKCNSVSLQDSLCLIERTYEVRVDEPVPQSE